MKKSIFGIRPRTRWSNKVSLPSGAYFPDTGCAPPVKRSTVVKTLRFQLEHLEVVLLEVTGPIETSFLWVPKSVPCSRSSTSASFTSLTLSLGTNLQTAVHFDRF